MARVQVLDKSVAERIAAGEVVERPASVVKELVENSLDAGASKVTVELQSGGIHRLKVSDDGFGMSREDAETALQRFATSKIQEWEDLDTLSSLGFRGEALPSIAAVSRLEIVTSEPGAEVGTRLVVDGGEVVRAEVVAPLGGTQITVSDLYYNTPARRKFLRSPAAETSQTVDLVSRLGITRPEVQFRVLSNGRELLMLPLGMTIADRLATIWKIPREALVDVAGMVEGVTAVGLVALPEHVRSNRTGQTFTVNGRLIKSAMLSQAVLEGFSPMVARGKFPFACLNLTVDPGAVDVNVHPTKAEVRFANQRSPFRAIHRTVASALEESQAETVLERHLELALDVAPEPVAQGSGSRTYPVRPAPSAVARERVMELYRPLPEPRPAEPPAFDRISPQRGEASPPEPQATLDLGLGEEIEILAQLHSSYIVALVDGDLWVIDQHAAHERIHYERLAHLAVVGGGAQGLVVPEVVELSPAIASYLEGHLEQFVQLGFEAESFGGTAFQLRSVPPGLKPKDGLEVFQSVVTEAAEGGVSLQSNTPEVLREKLRAMVACKSSIRAREKLTRPEMHQLILDLLKAERSPYCPHGRPTRVRLDHRALERLFHR